jgi:hypothetical protein
VDIGHHCQKWKSPILGVATVVLRDVFLASFFLAYGTKTFFAFAQENSPVQPLPLPSSPLPLPAGQAVPAEIGGGGHHGQSVVGCWSLVNVVAQRSNFDNILLIR